MERIPGTPFTNGDSTASPPTNATTVTAAWLNGVQEEICSFIEAQGLTLDPADYTQLGQAVALAMGEHYGANRVRLLNYTSDFALTLKGYSGQEASIGLLSHSNEADIESPSDTITNAELGSIGFRGFLDNGLPGSRALVRCYATNDWATSTNPGALLRLTVSNSDPADTSPVKYLELQQDGVVQVSTIELTGTETATCRYGLGVGETVNDGDVFGIDNQKEFYFELLAQSSNVFKTFPLRTPKSGTISGFDIAIQCDPVTGAQNQTIAWMRMAYDTAGGSIGSLPFFIPDAGIHTFTFDTSAGVNELMSVSLSTPIDISGKTLQILVGAYDPSSEFSTRSLGVKFSRVMNVTFSKPSHDEGWT